MAALTTAQLASLQQAMKNLAEDGFCVIPDVISVEKSQQAIDEIWTTIEGMTGNAIQRTNPATHVGTAWLPETNGIIMEPSEFFHAKPIWDVRKAAVPWFAHIWGTGDLVTSYDRINMMPAGGYSTKRKGLKMHTDQTCLRDGLFCLQGFIDLQGTGSEDGGLVVAKGSHLQHHELLYSKWGIREAKDWYKFNPDQREYIDQHFTVEKVTCPPRSLVLWDSRTFHQNKPPTHLGHARTIVYVCMMPKRCMGHLYPSAKKYETSAKKKREAFTNLRGTSHWPHSTKLFGLKKQDWGTPHGKVFKTTADIIQQPNVATDPVVASLTCFSPKPAYAMSPSQPLIKHADMDLLHLTSTQLVTINDKNHKEKKKLPKQGMKRAHDTMLKDCPPLDR